MTEIPSRMHESLRFLVQRRKHDAFGRRFDALVADAKHEGCRFAGCS
jgi:hypothetical protein